MTQLIWPYSDGECWDQGMLADLFAGKLYATGVPIKRTRIDDPSEIKGGGVIVLHGEQATSRNAVAAWDHAVQSMPWCVLVVTSDEQCTFDVNGFLRPHTCVWHQFSRPQFLPRRRLLLGYRGGTRDILAGSNRDPLVLRRLWTLSGQAQNPQRQALAQILAERQTQKGDGNLLVTGGFGQGMSQPDHLRTLAGSAVAPCPIGNLSPDTLRLYEALEAGCLPICDRNGIAWHSAEGFWRDAVGREPFPCVDDWAELPPLLDAYDANPVALQRDANRATSWWNGYKREIAHDLHDSIAMLSRSPRQDLHRVTVLMPTSSIPSHPSTALIEECIERTRAYPEMADAEVIIMIDGIHDSHRWREESFEEYKRALIDRCSWDPKFRGCLPLVFDEHTHQAGMTRRALELVRTPLIFYQEHDTFPINAIEWDGLFRAFDDARVNQIQLHIDHVILPEHRYLMMDDESQNVRGVMLRRHIKWSQRPHLARTAWYRRMIGRYFGKGAKTMIEDVIHGVLENRVRSGDDKWEEWGTWIYTPRDSDRGIVRSATRDGRDGERKIPLDIRYDGAPPRGAPHPGIKTW